MGKNRNKKGIIPWISLEGNISSGKTTLLKQIEEKLEIPTYYEKLNQWKFLKDFYEKPKEYSLIFQLEILFSSAEAHACKVPHLTERSSYSGFLIFAKNLKKEGNLNEIEQKFLEEIWQKQKKSPSLILYLDVSPEICLQRIKQRNRDGEQAIELSYLKALDFQYKAYLEKMRHVSHVIVLNKSEPLNEAIMHIKNHLNQLEKERIK